ncbi:MAG: tRNA (adenosine(37)-N6)-threonylcarbamoyltransferase complex dimerization subunit type 1 TsaB [Sphingobium sp.]
MRRLIIDTATEALSVALFADEQLIGHHHEIAGRGHAEKLIPIIAAMDGGGRAEEIWVDGGPGSFTGVRVGIAAARALAFAWNARLSGYSSLALVAAMARDRAVEPGRSIAVALTGGHGELFWQTFDRETLAPLTDHSSTPIDELAALLDARLLFGTGAATLIAARGSGDAVALHPDARLAPLLPHALLRDDMKPLYGRGADAIPIAGQKDRP